MDFANSMPAATEPTKTQTWSGPTTSLGGREPHGEAATLIERGGGGPTGGAKPLVERNGGKVAVEADPLRDDVKTPGGMAEALDVICGE